jgi:hypothetical protein
MAGIDPRPRAKAEATAELMKCGLPPRLLRHELAAAYVDLSPPSFSRGVAAGDWPQPIQDGNRKHWDRKALDAAADRRSGLAADGGQGR